MMTPNFIALSPVLGVGFEASLARDVTQSVAKALCPIVIPRAPQAREEPAVRRQCHNSSGLWVAQRLSAAINPQINLNGGFSKSRSFWAAILALPILRYGLPKGNFPGPKEAPTFRFLSLDFLSTLANKLSPNALCEDDPHSSSARWIVIVFRAIAIGARRNTVIHILG
jgi:hypothetical protein